MRSRDCARLGEHWEQSDLCEGKALSPLQGQVIHFSKNGITCSTILTMGVIGGIIPVIKMGEGGLDMAHVTKFNRGAVGHMLAHYDRSKDVGEHVHNDRTHLNYNLAQDFQPMKQLDYLHQRLSEIKVQQRKDVNVLCDWIVTAPKDLAAQDYERFFKACCNMLCERYGKKNVVSAYVHMDETTPHMHFAFIPVKHVVREDKKNPGSIIEYDKVSAKEVITKRDLQTFHRDLSEHVGRELGYEVSILNEATKEGNRSIAELKRQSATDRLREATDQASKMALQIVSEAQDDVKILKEQEMDLQRQIEGLQRDLLTTQQVKDVPHSKVLFGDKQIIASADFEALCRTAATAEELLKEIGPARQVNARATEIVTNAKKKAEKIIKQAEAKANNLAERTESVKYRSKLKHMEEVLNSNPQLVNFYLQAEMELQAKKQNQKIQQSSHYRGHQR